MKQYLGVGEGGHKLYFEKVHNACFLVHAEGNTESPFEFSSKEDALALVKMLCKFRVEERLTELL